MSKFLGFSDALKLALVERHGLAGFFLIHHEILQLAYEVAEEVRGRPCHRPPGRGRGSSVGSLICYLIGLSPNHHPIPFLRSSPLGGHEGAPPSAMLASGPDGTSVEVAGLVVCRQRPGTAKGFVFLVLEDEVGLMNLVVKPALPHRQRAPLP